jgi:CRISPR/Cas system-associated exonuclease Cas4 (RecB family)
MPIESFRCDVNRQPVHFKDCINCAQSGRARQMGCLHSPEILRGIVSTIRQPMEGLSVTELLECPRALWFKKKKGYQVQPSRSYWAFRGTMTHAMIEAGKIEGDISEVRMWAKFGPYVLSGQPDLIRPPKIKDWKTTKKVPKEPKEDHKIQLSCYRLLASKQEVPIEIESGEIVYIDMSEHVTLPVTLWSLKETEEWVVKRLTLMNEVLASDEPPKFQDHFSTQSWKCGRLEQYSYCDVRGMCTNGQTIEEPAPKARKVRESSR